MLGIVHTDGPERAVIPGLGNQLLVSPASRSRASLSSGRPGERGLVLQRIEGDFFPSGKVSEYVFPAGPKPVITVLPPLSTVTFC